MRRQDCKTPLGQKHLKFVTAVATYLSNTRITDEEKLKKIVVLAGVHGELEDEVDVSEGGELR